jgi:hypothetical protein
MTQDVPSAEKDSELTEHSGSKGAQENIRNEIGSNFEKGFNKSKLLTESEVENKPSTPPILREGLVRVRKLSFYLLSPYDRCGP